MANKYQHLNLPLASLDFHNRGPLTSEQIIELTEDFINECLEQNLKTISFIVGQGLHSANGPVIKPLLSDYLKQHPLVKNISPGKYTQGGQGVLIVKLK
jgi:DNA-nicking Smr family endonuclease